MGEISGRSVAGGNMTRNQIASELIHIAALMDDYGITDAIYKIVKSELDKILKFLEKSADETFADYDNRLHEGLVESNKFVMDISLPIGGLVANTSKDKEELLKGFVFALRVQKGFEPLSIRRISKRGIVGGVYSHDNLTIFIDVDLIEIVSLYAKFYKSRRTDLYSAFFNSVKRRFDDIDSVIHHELIHLLRDVHSHHVHKKERDVEWYKERGHIEDPHEIDAEIHEMARYMNKLSEKDRDKVTFAQLCKKFVPQLSSEKSGSPVLHRWIKRMGREGILTKSMIIEINSRSKQLSDKELDDIIKQHEEAHR